MSPKKKETPVTAAATTAIDDDVPAGASLDELLEWVGAFPGRAERARAAELAARKPRANVVDALDELLESM